MPHTPGPWFHNRTVGSGARAVWNTQGKHQEGEREILICTDGNNSPYLDNADEVDANMQLIAAAPDLLATLKSLHEAVRHMPNLLASYPGLDIMIASSDAIAKAEGVDPCSQP